MSGLGARGGDIAIGRLILGPCRCQGCGEEVVYMRYGRVAGWLHSNGVLHCHVWRAVA